MFKKIFSLICATLLVFSANAAPVAPKAELTKKVPVAVEMQKVQFEQAQTLNLNQLSATPALKVSNQKAQTPMVRRQSKATKEFRDKVTAKPAVRKAPTPVEITLVADTLDFFTKMLVTGGYYTVSSYNVDSTYEFSFYFISKSLSGNYTEKDMDAYSTWVTQKKGKGTLASYQNLSAANIKVSLVNDTLYYTGTMTLATNDGQEANITLNLSCPYKQVWGEWADFAPFEKNTGKYTFSAAASGTQTNIPVQVRQDNTGLKQYKFAGWGKQKFSTNGIDLLVDMASDYTCTVAEQNTGAYQSNYKEYIMVSDLATYSGQDFPSTYNPETGEFKLAMIYYISLGSFGYNYETMVMDKPITERDTVDIVSTKLQYNNLIASNGVVIFYAADVPNYYLFRVTSNATTVDGTFKWADGGINNPNSYFSVTSSDKNYFQDGEFTVVTEGKNIALTGWMIGEDEKYYRLNMSYTAPTTRDTVYFSGQGVNISECVNSQTQVQTGWIYQVADASTGYEFLIQSTVVANKYGTFSYADKTLGSNYYNVFDPQGNRQQFVEGSITVGEVGDSIVLNGELIAEDEKVYVLHFTQSTSILNYDTDAPFDATFAYSDMKATIANGVINISATNAGKQTIGLELYTDPTATEIPVGTYTISDTQEAGTALKSIGLNGNTLTKCWAGVRAASGGIADCWFIVEGTVTLSYDEYDKLKVVVDATNSYGKDVKATVQYTKINPKSKVAIDNATLSVDEGYSTQLGIMEFYGQNENGYRFDLYAYADTIVGDFLEHIDFVDCGITTPNGKISIIDAYNFSVVGIGKALTLSASVLGSDTIQYDITATGYYGAMPYDQQTDFAATFELDSADVQTDAGTGTTTLIVANDNGQMVALWFYATADGKKLPAGTYPINGTKEKNTVSASQGYTTSGYTCSFAAKIDDNDAITASWWMVGGEVVVAEGGSITVNAVNSYDKTITITITTAPTTRLFDVNANENMSKFSRNGQLYIRKGDKIYNALGAEVE